MIAARLWCQFQIGAKECCAEFCNKFLAGIAFIAPVNRAGFAGG